MNKNVFINIAESSKQYNYPTKSFFIYFKYINVYLFEGAIYELILVLYKDKVAGVKVYPRQT